MLVYPAIIDFDGHYYVVTFPDVPEAITQGESIEEAYAMAEEVLGLALEDKTDFPKASPLDSLSDSHTVALIGIDLAAYRRKYRAKTIRKNVTVPEWLNDMAVSENLNFSQTLTEALKEKLGV